MSEMAQTLENIGANSRNSGNSNYVRAESGFERVIPEPLGPVLETAEPYPLGSLGPLAAVAEVIAESVQCPKGLAAQSVLAAVALSAQHLSDVRNPLSGRIGPVSCFFQSIAISGERKSSVDGICLEPVTDFERARYESYLSELKRYEDEKLVFEQERKTALRTENAIAELEKLQTPEKPRNPMMILPEPTIEAIEKHENSNIGVFSDEGGRLWGGHAMNSDNRQKTVSAFSSLWDGKPIKRARASDDSFIKYDVRVSLHLMMQPHIASEVLASRLLNEQGFLARCLVTHPQSVMGTRFATGKEIPIDRHPCYVAYKSRLKEMLENDSDRTVIELDDEAKDLLRDFYNHIEAQVGVGGELHAVSGFAAKTAEHAIRLAALLAIYDSATTIGNDHIANGIRLAEHYLDEAVRLFGCPTENKDTQNARLLLQWVMENEIRVLHAVQIYQEGPNSLRESSVALGAAKVLVKHQYFFLEPRMMIDGKVRRNAWRVNAQIYEVSE